MLGITIVSLVKDGEVSPFIKASEYNAFFEKVIQEDGLLDTHISVPEGLSDAEKLEAVAETVNSWFNKDAAGMVVTFL